MVIIRHVELPAEGATRRIHAVALALALVASACGPTVPSPSPTTIASPTTPSATGVTVGCEIPLAVPCLEPIVRATIPVPGTPFQLTYRSDRVPGWKATPGRDLRPLGLGGWSLDVLDAYDPASRLFITGDGRPRIVGAIEAQSGRAAGHLLIASPDGSRVDELDPTGRHLATIDGQAGVDLLTFEYDGPGRLTTIRDRAGNATTIERDEAGRPTGIRSPLGPLTSLRVDEAGNLVEIVRPGLGGISLEPGADGLLAARMEPGGYRSTFLYDADGRLREAIDAEGATTRYERIVGADRETLTVTGPGGRAWTQATAQSPDGTTARTIEEPGGARSEVVVRPDGSRSITRHDGVRIEERRAPDPRWGLQTPILAARDTTTPGGLVQHAIGEQRTDLSDASDPLSVVHSVATLTVDGTAFRVAYDAASHTINSDGPRGLHVEERLDDTGRATELSLPGLAPLRVEYDTFGRPTAVIAEGDGARRGTQVRRLDGEGVVEVVDPAGGTSSIAFDESGRARWYTASDGSFIALRYDAAGRLLAFAPPGLDEYRLSYDGAGRQTSLTAPDGTQLETWRYDGLGRPLEQATGAGILSIAYDDAGRLKTLAQPSGDTTFVYADATDRPTTVTAPGAGLDLAWDGGFTTSATWSGGVAGRVSVGRDPQSRITSITVDDNPPITTTWSAAGLPEQVGPLSVSFDGVRPGTARLGSLELAWGADAFGVPSSFTATRGGTPVFALDVERDLVGRVTAATLTDGGSPVKLGFGYDAAARLASADRDGARTAYGYDARGNRLEANGPGGLRDATFDVLDRLTRDGSASFEYDGGGRLARRVDGGAVTKLAYDLLGNLTGVDLPDGRRVEYVVDGLGRRVGKRLDGKLVAGWLYLDQRAVAQLGSDGSVVATFGYVGDSPTPAFMVRGGRTYVILSDWLGSPRLVVDAATGSVAQALDYDAFGRVISDSQPGFQPFGFAGGLYDPDTGLVRFGARDYDAATGRWSTLDPLGFGGGDSNLYRYALGDPVNVVDRSGLQGPWGACGGRPQTYPWTFGVSVGGTAGTSPLGIYSTGISVQYIPGHGVAVYTFVPGGGAGSGSGFGAGVGVSGNVGYQGGCPPEPGREASSWEGPFESAGGGLGPAGVESYWSNFDPDNPNTTYKGVEAGAGTGLKFGAYSKKTDYKCIFNCGASHGDPHIFTPDGLHYEFQAAGEFVGLESETGDLVVQVRQEPYRTSRRVSVNTAVAMLVAGDRVGIYQAGGEGSEAVLHVDGKPVTMTTRTLALPHGGRVDRIEGGGFDVVWSDGSRIRATVYHMGALDLLVDLAAPRRGAVQGLFGNFDGDPANDLATRDGHPITLPARIDPAYRTTIYGRFADSWRIGLAESLFDYEAGADSATFTNRAFPDGVARSDDVPGEALAMAEDACRRAGISDADFLDDCIIDVGFTGDPGFAIAAGTSQAGAVPPSPTQEFSIGSDSVVGPDLPGPGAGTIAAAGERDVYRLTAPASGVLYLEPRSGCTADGLRWSVLDAAGKELPNSLGATSASVCQALGRVAVKAGTASSIVVSESGGATGTYGFTVRGVAPDTSFKVAIGDTVGRGRPGFGAGVVATPGEIDRFMFRAEAGDRIYLATTTPVGSACESGIVWDLAGPPDHPVAILPATACIDLGHATLEAAGDYTIEVSSRSGATGNYGFTIWRVPPDESFTLSLGVAVSTGTPGPGAGRIETPGSVDIYRIAVSEGQTVTIEPLQPSTGCGTLRYAVLDPDGSTQYSNEVLCAGMGRPAITVHRSGDLIVRVFGDVSNIGEYSFRVAS